MDCRNRIFSDAGPDGAWFTTDDSVSRYDQTKSVSGTDGWSTVTYNGPGGDGIWFTDDDFVETRFRDTSRDNEQILSSAGADRALDTEDDVVVMAQRSLGGFFGGWDRAEISYRDTGTDHLLGTLDDTVSHYATDVCKDGGNGLVLVEHLEFVGPGPDNTRVTPDDDVSSYRGVYVQYDPNTTTIAEICSPFPDSVWGPGWF